MEPWNQRSRRFSRDSTVPVARLPTSMGLVVVVVFIIIVYKPVPNLRPQYP